MASVEIDKFCRQVLAKRFPESAIFDDVTKVSGDDLRSVGFVSENGILTAGFPCQDISIAGKGRGLAGERSGLFWEIVRLLDELQPTWFVLENVPRLLSINGGRDMATVIKALADSGYGIAWRVLDAQFFGVPQRRRRLFIVGHLGGTGRTSAEILFEPESLSGDSEACSEAGAETSRSTGSGPGGAVTHTHLNPSGRREEGLPHRRRSGGRQSTDRVAALTASGVGTCGADDNQAQAGHLIEVGNLDRALREKHEQHAR